MNGPGEVVLFFWMIITAINAGVILFALVILLFRSFRWYIKLGIAAVGVVLAWLAQYYGFSVIGELYGPGPLDFGTVMMIFALFHVIALVALVWIIVWLFKRNVKGFEAVLKWTAIPLSLAGAGVTLMVLLFLLNDVDGVDRLNNTQDAGGIVVPESPDYHGGE